MDANNPNMIHTYANESITLILNVTYLSYYYEYLKKYLEIIRRQLCCLEYFLENMKILVQVFAFFNYHPNCSQICMRTFSISPTKFSINFISTLLHINTYM